MKGYSNELYILAFDHRGTLTKGLLGVEGRPPSEEEASRVSSMKDIIFDGFIEAKETGIGTGEPAILVDETFGLQVCLLYTSPSPRDLSTSRMPSSA